MKPERLAQLQKGYAAYLERNIVAAAFAKRMPQTHCNRCGRGYTARENGRYCRKCGRVEVLR